MRNRPGVSAAVTKCPMRPGHHAAQRRRLLGLMASLGGIALANGLAGWPTTARGDADGKPRAQGDLIMRTIPASGEQIPAAGMGTYRSFDIDPDDAQAMARLTAVMRAFVAGGGRVLDSSPMYGNAERVLGELARQLAITDRLWLATKVWTRGNQAGIAQMNASFDRLGVERLDLMQVHNLLDLDTQLATLKQWKAEGRLRYIGVSHYRSERHDDLARLIEREPLDFVQFNYSLLERNAEQRLLPACRDHGVATLINEPFAGGQFFRRTRGVPLPTWASDVGAESWAQLGLKYLIAHPAVTAVIPATGDPQHAADNVAAGRGELPDAAMRQRIVTAFEA